jgi:hypothetical protein
LLLDSRVALLVVPALPVVLRPLLHPVAHVGLTESISYSFFRSPVWPLNSLIS